MGAVDYAAFLADAVRHSTAARLMTCAELAPLPGQLFILERAVAVARAAGLQLPTFCVRWVDGRPEIAAGATERDGDRITVFLNANAAPGDLYRTTLHELAHVHDLASGLELSAVALEARAEAFVARAWSRR